MSAELEDLIPNSDRDFVKLNILNLFLTKDRYLKDNFKIVTYDKFNAMVNTAQTVLLCIGCISRLPVHRKAAKQS